MKMWIFFFFGGGGGRRGSSQNWNIFGGSFIFIQGFFRRA